ncbi:MAG: hypothetical protein LBD25_04665 [Coriobacteriales bacterium]|jgi:NRPS condensation-like uncharacterized protein|nr:hypothetical protein [Coriobacteriales bacterium]
MSKSSYKASPYDIWQSTQINLYMPLCRCRIDFAEQIDIDALKRAVDLSKRTLPLVGCTYKKGIVRDRWVNKGFSGEDIVRVVPAGDNPEERITTSLIKHSNIMGDPHVSLDVVRFADRDTLCLVVTHMLVDGRGLMEYLELIARLYTSLVKGTPLPKQHAYKRGTRPLFTKLSLSEKLSLLFGSDISDPFPLTKSTERLMWPHGEGEKVLTPLMREIAPESWMRLRAYAKRHGVTINDILIAAFARSFYQETGVVDVPIPSTIDLRARINPGTNLGITNYASGCFCEMHVKDSDSLADTAMQVRHQMMRNKTGLSVLRPIAQLSLATRLLPHRLIEPTLRKVGPRGFCSFSNVGILDDQKVVFGDTPVTRAFILAQHFWHECLHVAASTWRGRCYITCSYTSTTEWSARGEAVFDGIVHELVETPLEDTR